MWNKRSFGFNGQTFFMKTILLPLLMIVGLQSFVHAQPSYRYRVPRPKPIYYHPNYEKQTIQIALLLDVSNSMDGLIEQAKSQLWNLVLTTGKLRCGSISPNVEIAVYEYGRPTNSIRKGFVRQLTPFTRNLDLISQILFNIRTNGGEEYCGQAIYQALDELYWTNNPNDYKVIFIAGNEDFRQGNIQYRTACSWANRKGITVNTIYCGDYQQGIREHWNLAAECGNGSYSSINQNLIIDEMPTPYDDEIISLNEQLNQTYLSYGRNGKSAATAQAMADRQNKSLNKSAAVKRTMAKSKQNIYNNADWDMVDKSNEDEAFLSKVDRRELDDSLQGKSDTEIKRIVKQKSNDRKIIQQKIAEKSVLREQFIAAAHKNNKNESTLETEMEKIILNQAARFKMKPTE